MCVCVCVLFEMFHIAVIQPCVCEREREESANLFLDEATKMTWRAILIVHS